MDKIIEMINSAKDRLSNPFVFSFIISWFIWNWRIPVGLIWYTAGNIYQTGYYSFFTLISCQMDQPGAFLVPFFASIIITLSMPILKVAFRLFNAKITTLGDKEFFEIVKTGSISTARYMELRDKSISLQKQLSEAIDSESEYKLKFAESENLTKQLKKSEEILSISKDSAFLTGSWELIYLGDNSKIVMKFTGHDIQLTMNGLITGSAYLVFFYRDPQPSERLFFQISENQEDGKSILKTFDLLKEDRSSYKGTENRRLSILLRRVE